MPLGSAELTAPKRHTRWPKIPTRAGASRRPGEVMGPRGSPAPGRRLVPGGDGRELGRGVLEEHWSVPRAASHRWAALSCTGHLPSNCELRSRFPRGAKISNCAMLLPAAMIKLLIRSSDYSALLIPLLSRAIDYLARVAAGPGLAGLGDTQGTGTWGAPGCLCFGVLPSLLVRKGEMPALGMGPQCPLSVGLSDPAMGVCSS